MSEASEPREPLSVFPVLSMMIEQLASLSWQKLGLQPDVMTGRVEKHLDQARVAIDAVAALSGLLEQDVDDEDKRKLQSLVRDLRLNYVDQSKGV